MNTYKLLVSGRVQGVGYRNYVNQAATSFDIKGTVRNLSDGTVMIIAQTNEEILTNFIKSIKIPQHRFMKIEDISIQEIEIDKLYDTFSVVY